MKKKWMHKMANSASLYRLGLLTTWSRGGKNGPSCAKATDGPKVKMKGKGNPLIYLAP